MKKGKLSLVTRETTAGQFCYIVNENFEVCKPKPEHANTQSATTGIWLEEEFYPARADGIVVIPYSKEYDDYNDIIMQHQDFA